jgi:DNA-binding transcriptional MerR regulator
MALTEQSPIYNMKAVVRETGLTPDTLRVWERRYGIPKPERTSGGHRLYSQEDIDVLKWLVARREEGLSISHAVNLWKQSVDQGLEPLRSAIRPSGIDSAVQTSIDTLRTSWVERCLAFDGTSAEALLSRAISRYPLEIVFVEIIQKGINDINDRWYKGEASVHQVYFLSELTIRRLESMLTEMPVPVRSPQILAGNPPDEIHTLGLLLLTLLLRRAGWDVVYLGADLPLQDLDATLEKTRPVLTILSAQRLHTASTLANTAQWIADTGFAVAYGGGIFNAMPDLRSRILGYFLDESLLEVPKAVKKLIENPPVLPEIPPLAQRFRSALAHYRLRRPLLEAYMREALNGSDISDVRLKKMNNYFMEDIESALSFGDMSLLNRELTWLEGLLAYHREPVSVLYRYLNVYYRLARIHLGEEGQPIIDWLAHTTGDVLQ